MTVSFEAWAKCKCGAEVSFTDSAGVTIVRDMITKFWERHDVCYGPATGDDVVGCPKARGEGGKHSHEGGFAVCAPIFDAARGKN